MSLGGLIYIVGYTLLGYFAGPAVLGVVEALHLPVGLLGSGVPLLVLIALFRRPPRTAASAAAPGLTPGIARASAWWLARWPPGRGADPRRLVVITGDLAWRLPGRLAEIAGQLSIALARDATGGVLWLVVPLVAGVGWAACMPPGPSRG